MDIIRLDEVPVADRRIEPTNQFAEMHANDQVILVRQFLVYTDGVDQPEIKIGMSFESLAKLLGYSSRIQVFKLVKRSEDEFEGDLWNPNKIEGSQNGNPHETRSEGIFVVGEGIDLVLMKSKKPVAKEYRKKLKVFARQLRMRGALTPDKPDDSRTIELLEEKSKLQERLLTLTENSLNTAMQMRSLEDQVSSLQQQVKDSDRRVLAIVDEKINHQQGQREDEWSKLEAAREFDLFYPGTGKGRRHQAKFIGAIMKKHKFVKRRLARNGVWIDDSQIDRTTGEKGRVREAQYLNAAGMDQLELILPTFGLLAGEPKYIKLDDGDRSGHNVVWEPPAYVRSRRNRRR